MQEKGIISTNQLIWMLFIIISSVIAIQAPKLLIVQAGRDAWLSVIGGWFLDSLLPVIYVYMGIRFPGQNFVQYSITILGKYVGRMVGILYPLFFLLVCALFQKRGLSQLLNVAFMPITPPVVILVIGYMVAAYAARKGIEVMARVSEILGPLYILSIIVVGLLVIPSAEINRLKPQFEQGAYPFLSGSFLILTFYGICIMLAMFIPLCNRPENGFLGKFISLSIGALFVGIIVSFSVAVFGLENTKRLFDPGLELSRTISIGPFLTRLEIIWLLITIGSGFMASAILLWAFSLGVSQIVGLSTYKPLVYPAALTSLMLSLTLFENNVEQVKFLHYTYPVFAAFVEAGLEIFLFILTLILNKRG